MLTEKTVNISIVDIKKIVQKNNNAKMFAFKHLIPFSLLYTSKGTDTDYFN